MSNNLQPLPCPKLLPWEQKAQINGIFSYIIKHYGSNGVSLLVSRADGSVSLTAADWDGNIIDISKSGNSSGIANLLLKTYGELLAKTTQMIGLRHAQYYFAANEDLTLVDVRLSLNKLVGPGMIRDVFGRAIKTQEIIKIAPIDDKAINAIESGQGEYSAGVIIKPSRYRTNGTEPLYIERPIC